MKKAKRMSIVVKVWENAVDFKKNKNPDTVIHCFELTTMNKEIEFYLEGGSEVIKTAMVDMTTGIKLDNLI